MTCPEYVLLVFCSKMGFCPASSRRTFDVVAERSTSSVRMCDGQEKSLLWTY